MSFPAAKALASNAIGRSGVILEPHLEPSSRNCLKLETYKDAEFISAEGVLDVQGKAVENGLKGRDATSIKSVRIGKMIELEVDQDDQGKALAEVEKVCKELLANPVIERFEIQEG